VGQPAPVAYGKVFWLSRDGWITALDENTGGLVWKYAAMNPFGNATTPQIVQHASQLVIADGKIYRIAIQRPTFEGGPLPVAGSYGATKCVCLDAYTGRLIWEADNWFEAWGPRLADGKLFGSDYIYDRGLITEDYKIAEGIGAWTYCIGKGPTEMTISVDKVQVKVGETVKISGAVIDLSPASPGASAPGVSVNVTYVGPEGVRRPIAYLKTDKDGKFTYDWTPWDTGALYVSVESVGNNAYEAPDNAYMAIVAGSATELVPMLEGAIVVLIIVAIALPIIVWFARKPR
jgi:outer membrane protein assembly factor BamB